MESLLEKTAKSCTELYSHKHIVLCYEHYTPLGVVRSLGEFGIKPIEIIIKNNSTFPPYDKS